MTDYTEEALAGWDEALLRRPDDASAWYGRGCVLLHGARYEEALAAFERATEAAPEDTEAWTNKTVVLLDLGRYTEALEAANARRRACTLRATLLAQ